MSVSYVAIGWNRQKKIYDLTLLGIVFAIVLSFCGSAYYFHPEITAETLLIRGSAITAIVLLHLVLSIGPLTRIDSRFLPLLYNRRHLGVLICLIGLFHAALSVFQFHALGNLPARLSVIESYFSEMAFWRSAGQLSQIPFEPFGLITLAILILMAATSHDFWLKTFGPGLWKKIHVLVYFAYASLVIHISFGFLQSERHLFLVALLVSGAVWLATLHVVAMWKDRNRSLVAGVPDSDGFHFVCRKSELVEGRAKIVELEGQRIAIFLHLGLVSAVSNTCRHQGGPIGEGRILDGCITCPWHGWQYRPNDGCSPPPFLEVLPTFFTRMEGDQIFIHPKENLAVLPSHGAIQ